MAAENDIDPEATVRRVERLASSVRERVAGVVALEVEGGLDPEFAGAFQQAVAAHAELCMARLSGS